MEKKKLTLTVLRDLEITFLERGGFKLAFKPSTFKFLITQCKIICLTQICIYFRWLGVSVENKTLYSTAALILLVE